MAIWVVDTETGGLNPQAVVLEIAAVNVDTGEGRPSADQPLRPGVLEHRPRYTGDCSELSWRYQIERSGIAPGVQY